MVAGCLNLLPEEGKPAGTAMDAALKTIHSPSEVNVYYLETKADAEHRPAKIEKSLVARVFVRMAWPWRKYRHVVPVNHLREKGEITPPEYRELTGLSRKFLIPLLEHFDSEKVTIRVGDKRVLRRK